MQVAMSGLLGGRVVCVVNVFCFFFVCKLQHKLQDTTRMSMTVVVREDLCVYAEVLGRCKFAAFTKV